MSDNNENEKRVAAQTRDLRRSRTVNMSDNVYYPTSPRDAYGVILDEITDRYGEAWGPNDWMMKGNNYAC